MKTSTEQILDSFAGTPAQFNKLLKQEGIEEKLVRGRGYYYFVDGESSAWFSSSVLVYSLKRCTMRHLLGEYLVLKYNWQNSSSCERYVEWSYKEGTLQVMQWSNGKECIFAGSPLEVLHFMAKEKK